MYKVFVPLTILLVTKTTALTDGLECGHGTWKVLSCDGRTLAHQAWQSSNHCIHAE